MFDTGKWPIRIECPMCGYYMNLILTKDATLKSLEDMNWKQKVRNAIKKLSWKTIKGEAYIEINKLIDELEIEIKGD